MDVAKRVDLVVAPLAVTAFGWVVMAKKASLISAWCALNSARSASVPRVTVPGPNPSMLTIRASG